MDDKTKELLQAVLAYLRRTNRPVPGIAAARKVQEDGSSHLEGCEQDRFLIAERVEKALAKSDEV